MKKMWLGIASVVFMALAGGCNNFYHNLIPPDGDRILAFQVDDQVGASEIGENTIFITVQGICVQDILPRISISPGANIIPITFEYIQAAFPEADFLDEVLALQTAADLAEHVRALIRRTPGFNVPALDRHIDFSGPVNFFVVAGRGNIREYRVTIMEYTTAPRILDFRFTKYNNSELIGDAASVIRGSELGVLAMYPAEMPGLSFRLVPSFEILGDKLEIDGVEITSGVSEVQFGASFNTPQQKMITVTRNGYTKDFPLTVVFQEDPDSVRSITDFRFTRADNSRISANAVASIVNDGDYGEITVQVLYTGARPETLTPRFISPGTVRVGGVPQSSGTDSHNFSQPLLYRVTSRNLAFTRDYTVRVEFIRMNEPRMLSFGLSRDHNPGLLRDSTGSISGGHIVVDVHFGQTAAPEILIPEFRAEGIVTVFGSVQVSGVSPQNFSRHITYRVTHPLDSSVWRDYSVQTRLVRDTSSDALITEFYFHPDENPGLAEPLIGIIQQGRISVFAPVGFGVYRTRMIPRFTATGPVSVDGVEQRSGRGRSGRVFDNPVVYTVVSPNGARTMRYTVTVRELPSPRIFVNQRAAGHNDGTSWQNAFRCLAEATEAAAMFPDDVQKEIWIAGGTYTPGARQHFLLVPNTSYLGGFAGTETSVHQRNAMANRTILTGGSGALFAASGNQTISGDLSFENLEFTNAVSAITAQMTTGADVSITDVLMRGLSGSGIAVSGGFGERHLTRVSGSGFGASAITINGGSAARLYDIQVEDVRGSNPMVDTHGIVINATSVTVSGSRVSGVSWDRGQDWDFVWTDGRGISISGTTIRVDGNTSVSNTGGIGVLILPFLPSTGGSVNIHNVDIDGASTGLSVISATGSVTATGITVTNARGTGVNLTGSEHARILAYRITVEDSSSGVNLSARTWRNSRDYFGAVEWRDSVVRNITNNGMSISGNFNVTNVRLYNALGANSTFFAGGHGTFNNWHFINDPQPRGRQTSIQWNTPAHRIFSTGSDANITFENSSFINPSSGTQPGQTFIFSRWSHNPRSGTSGEGTVNNTTGVNLTLRNTVFDFREGGNIGLLALYSGQGSPRLHPDHLFMDGVRIYRSGNSNQPLIWLYGSPTGGTTSGTFRFRRTTLNGTTLNSSGAMTGQSGFIRLDRAGITMVP